MKTTKISITEAKQRLGELVKRSAYGGERFVIEFRGKPQAAIVACADIDWVPWRAYDIQTERERMKRLDDLRERIQKESGILPNSADLIREAREERESRL